MAERLPGVVDRSEATAWLRARLAKRVERGVLTVVWHSVVLQYLTATERADVEAVVAGAASHVPIVHAAMEPPPGAPTELPSVSVTTYRGGRATTKVIAYAHFHGPPVRMRSQ